MKVNNLDMVQVTDGAIVIRRNLIEFLEPGQIEGIREVCKIPDDLKFYSFLVPGTDRVSNFKPYEFMNGGHLLKLHPSLIIALQATRDALNARLGGGISLHITSGFRSDVDQRRLAVDQKLGWTDQGGLVSRNSMHRHGCAADFHARDGRTGKRVDKGVVYNLGEVYLDYVKRYSTTAHIHGDMRYTAGILTR